MNFFIVLFSGLKKTFSYLTGSQLNLLDKRNLKDISTSNSPKKSIITSRDSSILGSYCFSYTTNHTSDNARIKEDTYEKSSFI